MTSVIKNKVLEVRNLKKTYRLGLFNSTSLINDLSDFFKKNDSKKQSYLNALDDISFDIYSGDRVALLGKNGSGKSTFIKLISRITTPTYGFIRYKGKLISVIEQGVGFHPELTAIENIKLNASILGCNEKQTVNLIEQVVDFAELKKGFINTPIKRYSSGMITKLGFAISSSIDSDIFIIDEVLAVGDESFRNKCIQLLIEMSNNKKKTLIFVSHEMELVRKLCDRCLILSEGKLIYDGDIDKGIDQYQMVNNDI